MMLESRVWMILTMVLTTNEESLEPHMYPVDS